MSTIGKEYKLAIRIAGIIDKTFTTSLAATNSSLRSTLLAVNKDFVMLDKGFNKIVNVGKRCFSAIATAAGVAAVAIGAAAVAATRVGSEFESKMSTVKAISGATSNEMVLLTEKARELAQTSVFSAKEVGNAMEYMGMAGWKTEQILDGIGGVLDLAAASGGDFSLVSDIVTDDLTAFNMTAEETQRMVDVMAQAAMNSNTNVEMMGDTFKYVGAVAGAMGYSIEDIAIATGMMASSGIKASMAGTTLRNIITRMAKPTRESAEAMSALDLSLEKSDGTMYTFLEIMEKLRESMKGMTATQKAYYAAELGGQRGMTGLLAIANASDEEFQKLTKAIYNAEGAASKMAGIRLDNLTGDVKIFKDAVSDAGIELYYQFNEQLRDVVQFGTNVVNSAKVNIPAAFRDISAEFPTLQRKFKKYGEPVFDIIVNSGKWIIKNGKGIVSVLAGIGATMAAYKVASTGIHFITALMSLANLNPVTRVILGVVGALGALTTSIVACKLHQDEIIDNNLAEHFGSIALSMEELQQVAEHIVSTESLEGVKNTLEAFDGVELVANQLDEIVKRLDKMNWKVMIGMELSESEQGDYKTAIDEYIQTAQNYVTESQYAVSLGLKIGLGNSAEGANLSSKIGLFYQDSYNEMVLLGEQLSDAVNEAFADNILDPEEVGAISEIQSKMAELQRSLATSEFDAQLSLLGNKYGGNLDSDSFQNLITAINEQTEAATASYDKAYVKNRAAIEAANAAGEYLTQEDYQAAIDMLDKQYLTEVSGLQTKGIDFILQTIMQQYGNELNPLIQEYMSAMESAVNASGDLDWGNFAGSYVTVFDTFTEALKSGGLDSETEGAISSLLDIMAPSMEQMGKLRERYNEMGVELSQSMQEGFYKYNLLSALTEYGENGDNFAYLFGQGLSEAGLWNGFSEGFLSNEANRESADFLYHIIGQGALDGATAVSTENINKAAETVVQPAVEGIYAWSSDALREYFSQGFQVEAPVSISLIPSIGGLRNIPNTSGVNTNLEVPVQESNGAVSAGEQTNKLLGMEDLANAVELHENNHSSVEYKPTLQFYGSTPSKQDMDDALQLSQDKFNTLMDNWNKSNSRLAFGR